MPMDDRTDQGRAEGEPFLTGPTLYLRGVERDDAGSMIAWHPSPFPVPSDLALERLEGAATEAERTSVRLIACRRADDRVVGSIQFESEDQRTCELTIYANPLLLEAGAIRATSDGEGPSIPRNRTPRARARQ